MELFWQKFIDGYAANPGYWYVNKRLAIKVESLPLFRAQLEELFALEGQPWTVASQKSYYDRLISKRLIITRSQGQSDIDATASVRMVKAVLDSLGLVWTQGIVQATEVGRKFVATQDPQEGRKIIEEQIRRYQFWNPSVEKDSYEAFELVPYHFLLSLLLNQALDGIRLDELPLFVLRARSATQAEEVTDLILKWRALDSTSQRAIIAALQQRYRHQRMANGQAKRFQPLWKTIQQALTYIKAFYLLPAEFQVQDGVLRLAPGKRGAAEKVLENFRICCDYIRFKTEADWFAYYGVPGELPTIAYAQDYYLRVGDIENAKMLGYVGDEESREAILEKQVEEILEKDVARLEHGLKLVAGGRQYPTSVGPIDLLAKDSSGNFVVFELKRGRTSDKVMGQISRYIGWVKKYLSHGEEVRGIVVGKTFNENFALAASNSRAPINLYTFDDDFNFTKITS